VDEALIPISIIQKFAAQDRKRTLSSSFLLSYEVWRVLVAMHLTMQFI